MGNCYSCRWWKLTGRQSLGPSRGDCFMLRPMGPSTDTPARIHGVAAGWLNTDQDFGCKLHEDREP